MTRKHAGFTDLRILGGSRQRGGGVDADPRIKLPPERFRHGVTGVDAICPGLEVAWPRPASARVSWSMSLRCNLRFTVHHTRQRLHQCRQERVPPHGDSHRMGLLHTLGRLSAVGSARTS
jgi:hypothetical protein